VPGAPEFPHAIQAVYAAARESAALSRVLDTLRRVALEAGAASVPDVAERRRGGAQTPPG
jgi:hypothetical protein